MRWFIVMALPCVAAGPATNPTTNPNSVADLQQSLSDAESAAIKAKEVALANELYPALL